jgi:hypothetical protein
MKLQSGQITKGLGVIGAPSGGFAKVCHLVKDYTKPSRVQVATFPKVNWFSKGFLWLK